MHNMVYNRPFFSQLEDLDYADDMILLSTVVNHLQKKAQLLIDNAMKTGLQSNSIRKRLKSCA